MEHFWRNVEGYFTFPAFYRWLVEQMPHNPSIIEVGCWKGQSAAFLGVELVNAGKCHSLPAIYLVDTFTEAGASWQEVFARLDPIKELFAAAPGRSTDPDILNRFGDGRYDAVFIDADHTYEAVKADIAAWLPKVKPGGILAGHDFKHYPQMNFGVIQAVTEAFDKVEVWPGITDGGNEPMQNQHWPVWCYRVPK